MGKTEMIRSLFYWKKEGPRYIWFFPRKWIKWTGLQAFAEVKAKR
jgi:hypothetical protein